jgi:ribonuclease HII
MTAAKSKLQDTARGKIEQDLEAKGLIVAGVDEVGRGCLAGPVFAGCVVLEWSRLMELPKSELELIRDSKKLSSGQRARILPIIHSVSRAMHVASASVDEISQIGILPASFLAMRRAIAGCGLVDLVLVDGKLPIAGYELPQRAIVRGDYACYSIAAASIMAKTSRDALMANFAKVYPGYGFESHVGYGTKAHLDSISKLGVCSIHRTTFAPIRLHIQSASSTAGSTG